MSMPSGGGIEAAPRWSLRLFGGFDLRTSPAGERVSLPGKRERLLLAYLALAQNGRQARSKLAVLLWGSGADETSADNLRTCLWGLRKALGDTEHRVLASDGEDIVLDARYFDIDAVAFQRHSAEASRTSLEAAAKLCTGELLDGIGIDSEDFEDWRRLEATRYAQQAASVRLRLMAELSEAGETECAIEAGVTLLRIDPLNEAAARRLMSLYRDAGRRGAAIDVYRTLAGSLRKELDAEPDEETRAAFADISRSVGKNTARVVAPAAAVPQPSAPPATMPPETMPPAEAPAIASAQRPPPSRMRAMVVTVASMVIFGIVAYGLLSQMVGPRPAAAGHDAIAKGASPSTAISIVVLPFANLSGDPGQEFFSDGMTEEVTAALARIPSLRVVARTSAFQFKGPGQDVRAVARSLGASHLVEGSVRRSGTQVRVNAQLIEAASGTDLWTESYAPAADDLLAMQDDIAKAIADALQMPLGIQGGSRAASTHVHDLDTYQRYLRARALVHSRGYESLTEAAALLEQVVVSDPDYAPAWANLAEAYVFGLNYHPAWTSGDFETLKPIAAAWMAKAEAASRRAIELDPKLADGYAVLGLTLDLRGDLADAEDLYRQAMALDPTNADVLHFYSRLLAELGRLEEALEMRRQLQALDPFVPVYQQGMAWLLWVNGQTDDAIAISESEPLFHRAYSSPRLLATAGRYEEAAHLIETNASGMFMPGVVEAAARLIRSAPAQVADPAALPRLGWFNFVYMHVGAPERALEFYEGGVEAGYSVSISNAFLWHSDYATLRKTERYKQFMRRRGVVDYWRERGWPTRCRPVGIDDFTCE
jgi:TolB-like protein/DNA-binding SARP family transcriptional activator